MKPTQKYDVVFVGAGPASLMAAASLKAEDTKILIVDSGPLLQDRFCPTLAQQSCGTCSTSLCPVIEGIGGSSAFLGNKLCYMPASSDVLDLVPGHDLHEIEAHIDGLLGVRVRTHPSNIVAGAGAVTRKFYDVDILFRRSYMRVIADLLAAARQRATLKPNANVRSISREPDGSFTLDLPETDPIVADHVVIGTGRAGHKFLRETLRDLDLDFDEQSPDVGLRLEAPTEAFTEGFFYQDDPKFKFKHEGLGTSRTFCGCKGGLIVPVTTAGATYADGAFANVPSGRTNVALMVRSNTPLASSALLDWCTTLNRKHKGLSVARVTSSDDLTQRVMSAVETWPTPEHASMMRSLIEAVSSEQHVPMFKRPRTVEVGVFAPAVDLYWPKPKLNAGFTTQLSGLSIIGDATGLSRGIVQAFVSGAAWAKAYGRLSMADAAQAASRAR